MTSEKGVCCHRCGNLSQINLRGSPKISYCHTSTSLCSGSARGLSAEGRGAPDLVTGQTDAHQYEEIMADSIDPDGVIHAEYLLALGRELLHQNQSEPNNLMMCEGGPMGRPAPPSMQFSTHPYHPAFQTNAPHPDLHRHSSHRNAAPKLEPFIEQQAPMHSAPAAFQDPMAAVIMSHPGVPLSKLQNVTQPNEMSQPLNMNMHHPATVQQDANGIWLPDYDFQSLCALAGVHSGGVQLSMASHPAAPPCVTMQTQQQLELQLRHRLHEQLSGCMQLQAQVDAVQHHHMPQFAADVGARTVVPAPFTRSFEETEKFLEELETQSEILLPIQTSYECLYCFEIRETTAGVDHLR